MKRIACICVICLFTTVSFAQEAKQKIERACLDYIEGFYEGDTVKLSRSIKPSLYKFGYWKNKSGAYDPDGHMTFQQAKDYAKKVADKKNFAKEGSPKKVEVLDIMNSIASAKVTAWWGVDYILLSKQNDKWMIEQVLWEGPLEK
ncbi:MAG TPA: nuclear transport factor 2 family protein [Ferruginibacter sp.]|nr:nuclear transport factor 2 family protein [Ferruginibacter sp.]